VRRAEPPGLTVPPIDYRATTPTGSRVGHLECADIYPILDVSIAAAEEGMSARSITLSVDSILRLNLGADGHHGPSRPEAVADRHSRSSMIYCRALASYGNLVRNLDQIGVAYGRQGAAQRHARGVRNRLEHSNMDDIFQHGVHEFIQEFILDNARLGEIITKQYLI
jgi:hypothetical protein